jgi:hypothetical protein
LSIDGLTLRSNPSMTENKNATDHGQLTTDN